MNESNMEWRGIYEEEAFRESLGKLQYRSNSSD